MYFQSLLHSNLLYMHTHVKNLCQNYFDCLSLLWQALMCCCMLPRRLNDFEQWVHWKGFSPVCMSRCRFSWLAYGNFLWQQWHSWVFLPESMSEFGCLEWMSEWWRRRLLSWLNDFRHTVHWWGFSPVCVSTCLWRISRRENSRWHVSHLNGFSPVWVVRCRFRWLANANFLWQ